MFSSGTRGGGGMRGYNQFSGGMDDDDDEFGPFGGGGGFRSCPCDTWLSLCSDTTASACHACNGARPCTIELTWLRFVCERHRLSSGFTGF